MSKHNIYFKSIAYLILFFFLVLLLQQCSPSKSKEKDKIFDSLVKTMSRNINYNADTSLKTSKVILSLAQENNNPFQMYVAAKLMGNSYELSGKNDSAIKYYVVMKDIAFQINDSSKIVQVCSCLGNVFLDNGISDSAFLYFNIGKKVAIKIKDSIQEAYILASLGAYYMATKYADSAFLCLTKAATFFENLGDSAHLAQVYRNLAHVLLKQNFERKAINLFLKAVSINKNLGKYIEVGLDYSNLAITYKTINQDTVRYYFQLAMNYIAKSNSISNLMMVKFNYANYLKREGKIDEAEKIYKEVLEISTENNILKGQIFSLNLLAKIAIIKKDIFKANGLFNKALELALKNKINSDILRLYLEKFEGNLELSNTDTASKYYYLWRNINDSLQTNTQNEAVVKYQTLYETQKKETEIKSLEIKNANIRSKSKYLIAIYIISILVVLAVFLVIRLKYKNSKQNLMILNQIQKAQELEIINKDLMLNIAEQEAILLKNEFELNQKTLVFKMLMLSQNNEMLTNLIVKLKDLNNNLENIEQRNELNIILNLVKSNLQKRTWDDFEQQYAKNNEIFFTKLNEQYPNLTSSERRLCALLRMNLAIKEISDLTKQTPRAVEVARYRLRTKFALERDENLAVFLSKF